MTMLKLHIVVISALLRYRLWINAKVARSLSTGWALKIGPALQRQKTLLPAPLLFRYLAIDKQRQLRCLGLAGGHG